MARKAIVWTPEKSAALTEMYRNGARFDDMADALGVSINAARQRVRKLRLPKRAYSSSVRWTPEMDAALFGLRSRGVGYRAAAEVIGVDSTTCCRRVKQLGLPTWGRGNVRRGEARA